MAVLADSGASVIGVDHDTALVARFVNGQFPQLEPDLASILAGSAERLVYTTDTAAAVLASDVTFILVPTPSMDDGAYSNVSVIEAVERAGAAIAAKDCRHLVVIVSTVMPRTMQDAIAPALVKAARRELGPDLGLCYCPEFVALGAVIEGMRRPELVLIGQSDDAAGAQLLAVLRPTWRSQPAIHRLEFINAELAKIAINGFVTTKISYANMIAELCETLPGADARKVTRAMGSDARIGPGYLNPGLGYSGPCFPRDNRALAHLAARAGLSADIAVATDRINRRQARRIIELVKRLVPAGSIAVLGLTYKPGSNVTEAAQGIEIAAGLAAAGYCVRVHDPEAVIDIPPGIQRMADARECARHSDVVVIATPWPEYDTLVPFASAGKRTHTYLVDCWGMQGLRNPGDAVTLIIPGTSAD